MIETKPIYSVMKLGAMNAMKSTTQKAGIDWDGHVRRMAATPEVGPARSSRIASAQHSTASFAADQQPAVYCPVQVEHRQDSERHLP